MSNPPKNGVNPHFKSKYTTLDDLQSHIRPLLAEQDLCILTPAVTEENKVGVKVIIMHESGEYIMFDCVYMPVERNNAQAAGSALTYATRYAICAALSISGDEDDDANRTLKKQNQPNQQKQPKNNNNQNHANEVKQQQMKNKIWEASNQDIDIVNEALEKNGLKPKTPIPEGKLDQIIGDVILLVLDKEDAERVKQEEYLAKEVDQTLEPPQAEQEPQEAYV